MRWVTKGQLERAREYPVLKYILDYEGSEYKRVGRGYRLRSDDALAVDENGWYCHKRCTGSKTALDYLVEIKGYGLVEAVCFLLGESPQERSGQSKSHIPVKENKETVTSKITTPTTEPPKPPAISLPIRNKDNKRVIAYLQSRGIDRASIMDCIERGVLFECKYYHNAVFLGKDENGRTRYAAMRSTSVNFMRDAEGSDKKYGFVIPPDKLPVNKVAVFESPIDCLSHQSLCKQGYIPPFDGWRLSLGCFGLAALEHFLPLRPEVTHCIVCTDNDRAGDIAAEKIAGIPGITAERLLPPSGKDWNDALQAAKKAERTQNRVHPRERG